jgi:hypothetical protein
LKGALAFHEIEVVLDENGFVAVRSGVALRGRHATEQGVVLVAAWIPR